jgi:hypothetical protein
VTGAIASDQRGQFPITSAQAMKYVMVVYNYDSNAIIAELLINYIAKELLQAYTSIYTPLVKWDLQPKLQHLHNNSRNCLKYFMEEEVDFQLVPPGIHRRNAAEWAI